jgi:addiction module HigA family antidote
VTREEVFELNKGRYTFRKEHTSTTYKGYKKFPGHVLVEDFLAPFYPAELSDLAKRTGIPLQRLRKLIRGQDRIDPAMAEALGKFYQNGAEYWLDLQARYESGQTI